VVSLQLVHLHFESADIYPCSSHHFPLSGTDLPEELQGYHTLVPLEAHEGTERRKLGNWYSVVYRAIRSSDGMPYALRRVEGE
jgi:hypothetical protein